MVIRGIPPSRIATRLEDRARLLAGVDRRADKHVMLAAVGYIRFLEEQLAESQQAEPIRESPPEEPRRPRGRPRKEPANVFTDLTRQTVVASQPGMTVRRIRFK